MGRVRFERTIPWSLASEHEFARPKPGIIAKLDHRPMLDGQSSNCGYKNNGVLSMSSWIRLKSLDKSKTVYISPIKVGVQKIPAVNHCMTGLGMWTRTLDKVRCTRLKAQKKKSSQGKSLLSSKDQTSGLGESAAVHFVQTDLLGFGDDSRMNDDDPAVVRTVEVLSVAGCDVPVSIQEKETKSIGGIYSDDNGQSFCSF